MEQEETKTTAAAGVEMPPEAESWVQLHESELTELMQKQAKAAITELKRQEKQERKKEKYHNTFTLMKCYRDMAFHIENAISDGQQLELKGMTDEQRYSEEQDAIDRQTKKKLQERADAEKMEHLPSEGNIEHKQHELKIVASDYEDVISGKKSFELRKNDRGYKQGDSLKMLEFKDGKHTGRMIDADIIYMLEDYTGLTEGYCILGIRVTDYTGKVSETDTESGAVNV